MAQRKQTSGGGRAAQQAAQFIVSDERRPEVALKPGMRLEVRSVTLVDAQLKKPKNLGARLCGGSGTCLAIVKLGDDVINPPPTKRPRGAGARRGKSS